MGKIAMAFSSSFIVGGLATYWMMNHSKTGFALDRAAVILIVLAGVVFVTATITFLVSRQPKETSAHAIERQMVDHHNKAA